MDQAAKLRMMANSHQQLNPKIQKAKIITVASGKGGVGKSNVTMNIALELAKQGQKVVIIDADLGLSNIEVLFGIVPSYTLSDMFFGKKGLMDILTPGPYGIHFISSGSGVQDWGQFNSIQLQNCITQLQPLDQMADIIFIDTGAGVSQNVIQFIQASDDTIIVTTPEPTSIMDAYALIKTLKKNIFFVDHFPTIHLLVNRVDNKREGREVFLKIQQVTQRFLDISICELGFVPYDYKLIEAVKRQQPLCMIYPKSAAAQSFSTIAKKLLMIPHEEVQRKGLGDFMKKIIHLLGGVI